MAVPLLYAQPAEDWSKSCKAGLYNCGCKHGCHQWTAANPRTPLFEKEELCKQGSACWGDLAQFNCAKGKKAEVMEQAFAEARKTNRPLLYFGNTGG
jgi:hypothetical protein